MHDEREKVPAQQGSFFRRMMGNLAWLVLGKGFGGVCSIVYLAILSRTLGVKGFGHFSLLFGTAQALVAIVGFQTWQAVVRYGTGHIAEGRWDRFGRLAMLGGLLDSAGALVGCAFAFLIFVVFGEAIGISPRYTMVGFLFSCAIVWARVSAPTGILRALGRFDLAVYVEAMVPLLRLVAAAAIWLTGANVFRYLLAWAVIDLASAVVYWIVAWRACPQAVNRQNLAGWRGGLAENDGLRRFFMVTYLAPSLDAVVKQGPMLAVGAVLGTSMAGIYRLADQVVQGLGKLSALITRSIYSEISRAHAVFTRAEFLRFTVRTSVAAAVAGGVISLGVWLLGRPLLALIGGEAFEGGAGVLLPLALGASVDLASVAFEPALHAAGRPMRALIARGSAVLALLGGLVMWIHSGPEAAAWTVTLAAVVNYVVMGGLALVTIGKAPRAERA